ncbi:hypothetical protein GE061_016771 [Apolygus lucorum]|uniref:HTH psq-type domain-containing protein n=1 Tax=Apolygus lucorum TaxID=248454 RepID=A0A8S9XH81_APOLU|nr:hypothetical protein GE061_016771 [Apolygus lucorum]
MSLGVLEAVRNLFGGDLANVPVIMSYTNWDSRHRRLQMHDWAKLDDLVDWLRQVRYMGFHVRVNRDRIKQLYAVIIVRAPFSATQRFPEGVLYVDVDNVHVRTLIDQIVLSLDMPDRQIEKGGMAYDSSDAKRAFDVGVQSLMAAMLSEEDAAGVTDLLDPSVAGKVLSAGRCFVELSMPEKGLICHYGINFTACNTDPHRIKKETLDRILNIYYSDSINLIPHQRFPRDTEEEKCKLRDSEGLIPFVGKAYKWLFGIGTDADYKTIRRAACRNTISVVQAGSGTSTASISATDEAVLKVITVSATGLSNDYDCGAECLAVVRSKEMTQREAAAHYKIARSTIINKLGGKHSRPVGKPSIFTQGEENEFVYCLIKMSEYGFPMNKTDLRMVTIEEESQSESEDDQEVKRYYKRFTYTEEDLAVAIRGMKAGTLSIYKAAKIYGIPKGTLFNKVRGKVPMTRKMGPPTVLSQTEEENVMNWILNMAKLGFPMHGEDVKDTIQKTEGDTNRLQGGFQGIGIHPLNREVVLKKLSHRVFEDAHGGEHIKNVSETFLEELKKHRKELTEKNPRRMARKKMNVPPGKGITVEDLDSPSTSSAAGVPSTSGVKRQGKGRNDGTSKKRKQQKEQEEAEIDSTDEELLSEGDIPYAESDDSLPDMRDNALPSRNDSSECEGDPGVGQPTLNVPVLSESAALKNTRP